MNALPVALGVIASALGFYYVFLGIAALKHLPGADEIDKTVGWAAWWCLESVRYDEEGRRLCKKGQVLAIACIACWIAVFAVKR
jgi:hypothetical protein